MALDLEMHRKIRNNNNTFAKVNGIEAIELKEGYAVAKMEITPDHYNPLDTVHGGAILTLADVAASYSTIAKYTGSGSNNNGGSSGGKNPSGSSDDKTKSASDKDTICCIFIPMRYNLISLICSFIHGYSLVV